MILTDEERERIAKPFVRTIGSGHWYSGDDGIRDDGDIEKFAAAIESTVLRKLRGRPADAWINGRRDVLLDHPECYGREDEGWTPLHIIPEVNE